jgi:Carboxypeptidase regulatory-like domain
MEIVMRGAPAAVILSLACSSGMYAQEQWATIHGTVRDQLGVPTAATVQIVGPTTSQSIHADTDGSFTIRALEPGIYSITVSKRGFRDASIDQLRLVAGQVFQPQFSLSLANVEERVEVTAQPRMFDVTSHAKTTFIPQEIIQRVPKGRDFTSLVAAATPGTNAEVKSAGLQVDGASGAENRFFVNGIDTTHLQTGTSDKEAIVDFLEEVQVKSSGFSASNRVATGGAISAVTKAGSNNWHGSVGTYYDSSGFLAGNARANLRVSPSDGFTPEYVTPPEDDVRTWEPLGEIGGPLSRDRVWMYAGYALRTHSLARDVHFTEDGSDGRFDARTNEHNFYGTLTPRFAPSINSRLSTILEQNQGSKQVPTVDSSGQSVQNPALYPSRTHTNRGSELFSGTFDWLVRPRLAITATGGLFTSNAHTENAYTGYQRRFQTPNFQFSDIPADWQHAAGYTDAPSPRVTLKDDFSRTTLDVRASQSMSAFGAHMLSGGIQLERLTNLYDGGDQSPVILLYWDRTSPPLLGSEPGRGEYGYYTVSQIRAAGDVADTSWGWFVQDLWRVNSRLSVDLGVRADREEIPSYRPGLPGLRFGFGDKVAPRLGIAWDPTGAGRSRLYGGWGRFYDLTKLELPRQFFGALSHNQTFLTLDRPDWPFIECTSPPVSGSVSCPGRILGAIEFRPPLNVPDAMGHPSIVAPGVKPFRTSELTVGFEHQLGSTLALSTRYVRKRLDRAIEDVSFGASWEEIDYKIANPGEGTAKYPLGPAFPAMPLPVRSYDGVEIQALRRLSNSWSLNASYTFSHLRGNYSGLANSDDNGRNSPNIETAFDSLHSSFDQTGRPVHGPLATDRPHVLKVQATYDTRWGTGLGANVFVESGTPRERFLFAGPLGYPVYYRGRSSDGRTPTLTSIDLLVRHAFRLARSQTVELELTALNLFDSATPTSYWMSRFLDGFYAIPNDQFFAGWDPEKVAEETGILTDPAFGLANSFQERRRVRVAMRFRF